jgi:pyrroloquinoline quinone biosynthesis protein B
LKGGLVAGLIALLASSCAAPPPSTPYVVVLGTAQDGGLPHAACTCRHCDAARRDPARRRRVASIAIVVPGEGKRYLVDASPDLREQLDQLPAVGAHAEGGVDRAPVDGVLLTHAHVGHYLGLAFFGFEAVHTSNLPVWATPRMAAFLRENGPWSRLVARDEIVLREAPPGVTFELAPGVRVTPFTVPHRDEDSDTVAFRIEGPQHSVFYAPDTDTWSAWDPIAREALARCDAALIDGTFYAPGELPGRDLAKIGHPLIETSMDLFEGPVRAGRLRVLFTHLNHSNGALEPGGPERRTIERRGFSLAEDGQRLPL